MKYPQDYFFQTPSHYKVPQAIEFARINGLATKIEDGNLFIQAEFYPVHVAWEDGPLLPAYERRMTSWNGWTVPYFTEETVDKLRGIINKELENDYLIEWIDVDGDKCLQFTEKEYPEEASWYGPLTINVPEPVQVWECGFGWTWETKDEKEVPVVLEEFGCAVRLVDGSLESCPLFVDGTPDDNAWGQVEEPQSQEFLDTCNKLYNKNYKMEDFGM